jgi:hypothetical protein
MDIERYSAGYDKHCAIKTCFKTLPSYLYFIRRALRDAGKYHVSTDDMPAIRIMYSSYYFAAEEYIMAFQVLTALRTGEDDTESPGM